MLRFLCGYDSTSKFDSWTLLIKERFRSFRDFIRSDDTYVLHLSCLHPPRSGHLTFACDITLACDDLRGKLVGEILRVPIHEDVAKLNWVDNWVERTLGFADYL